MFGISPPLCTELYFLIFSNLLHYCFWLADCELIGNTSSMISVQAFHWLLSQQFVQLFQFHFSQQLLIFRRYAVSVSSTLGFTQGWPLHIFDSVFIASLKQKVKEEESSRLTAFSEGTHCFLFLVDFAGVPFENESFLGEFDFENLIENWFWFEYTCFCILSPF